MLFVDPESNEGVWLRTPLNEDITLVPEGRITACASALRTFSERPLESMEISDVIRHCVSSLCAGPPPSRRFDERVSGRLAVPALYALAQADARDACNRKRADRRRGGACGGLCGRRPPHAYLLPDVRNSALSDDARRLLRDRLAVQHGQIAHLGKNSQSYKDNGAFVQYRD